MNNKQKRTLEAIFTEPIKSNIIWNDIESMLESLGAEISQGNGSRVRICFLGIKAVFHRPHPQKESSKGSVKSVREFLIKSGVKNARI